MGMTLDQEDICVLEEILKEANRDITNNFEITKKRLGKLDRGDYYYYVLGFIFSSFLNTFSELHQRDTTEEEQDEIIGIIKMRAKEAMDRIWGE